MTMWSSLEEDFFFDQREFIIWPKLEKQKQISFVNAFLSLTFIYCRAEIEPEDVGEKHLVIKTTTQLTQKMWRGVVNERGFVEKRMYRTQLSFCLFTYSHTLPASRTSRDLVVSAVIVKKGGDGVFFSQFLCLFFRKT